MLPFGGQGSNCAMEDAGALGRLFRSVHDPAAIEPRLALFEQIRKNRASRIQIESKVRLGKEEEIVHELKKYADPPGSGKSCIAQGRFKHSSPYAQPLHLQHKSELLTTMSMMFLQNVRRYCKKHNWGTDFTSGHYFQRFRDLEIGRRMRSYTCTVQKSYLTQI